MLEQSVCIVMPVFNEGLIAREFLRKIDENLSKQGIFNRAYICVNDQSTDDTFDLLSELSQNGFPIKVITNLKNVGHGVSTLRALRLGLECNTDFIVALDSDAQFDSFEISQVCSEFLKSNFDLCECVRINRSEPLYRKMVSFITKILLFARIHQFVRDPNTPFRIYTREYLEIAIGHIPPNSPVPNLYMSHIARGLKKAIYTREVSFLPKV